MSTIICKDFIAGACFAGIGSTQAIMLFQESAFAGLRKTLPHQVCLNDHTHISADELADWLDANMRGLCLAVMMDDIVSLHAFFQLSSDAALFRLRW